MNVFLTSKEGLTNEEIIGALEDSLEGKELKNVLILPPDYTRYHSNAGFITNQYYHMLTKAGVHVDIMPALGTHVAMTDEELEKMYGDIPHETFLVHNWRTDVEKIGVVPAAFLSEVSESLWNEDIDVEVNKHVLDPKYDLILSVGQVVPHEVVGMSNHAKNLFVGAGGSRMINASHMLGAIYGLERMMGKDQTPVRKLYDYAFEHFLSELPIVFALTVTTAPGGNIHTHGLFISPGRECFNEAVKLAQEMNVDFVEKPFKKCVVYLDPVEFKSTWLGNKAIYRTRMAMADDGELIILAPGVDKFGEDGDIDKLIRKYGYVGRINILNQFNDETNQDLRDNMSAAAHLIHGSSDDRFHITYAVKNISEEEIRGVGYDSASYEEMCKTYDPEKLTYGYNEVNGEEVFFVPNPALGLWIDKNRFEE
ncbi:MAG: DUF2088 domain-containing protein [Solobacterium sp.]|nr:DUF2088 domain-containing protein [Solobacterium sp.]